jgi:hypothetical protein
LITPSFAKNAQRPIASAWSPTWAKTVDASGLVIFNTLPAKGGSTIDSGFGSAFIMSKSKALKNQWTISLGGGIGLQLLGHKSPTIMDINTGNTIQDGKSQMYGAIPLIFQAGMSTRKWKNQDVLFFAQLNPSIPFGSPEELIDNENKPFNAGFVQFALGTQWLHPKQNYRYGAKASVIGMVFGGTKTGLGIGVSVGPVINL